MSAPPRSGSRRWQAVLTAAVCAPLGGCLAYEVVSAPVKVGVGAAEVAGTVAVDTAKVAGSVASGAIKLAASVTRSGTVTFVDLARNDAVARVPWQKGLTLAGASMAAKVSLNQRGVNVVREGKIVLSAANGAAANALVASGDVVQMVK